MAEKFRFGIPLRPTDRPRELTAELKKSIENEYASRYLEVIGATPTAETLRLVRKHMPLSKCSITAAWRSRGWISDTVYVAPFGGRGESAHASSKSAEAAAAAGGVGTDVDVAVEAVATAASPKGTRRGRG